MTTHKKETWMLRTCRERKKREGEKNWRYWLMFNGGIQFILPNLHTKQYPTTSLDIITLRNVYSNWACLLKRAFFLTDLIGELLILNPIRTDMSKIVKMNLRHQRPLCLEIHGYRPPRTPGRPPSAACQESLGPWSRGTGLASRWCVDATPASAHMGCLCTHIDQWTGGQPLQLSINC